MLRWISIFGGLLIMMGQHDRSEALFYYFRLEDQVPENHLLRLIDQYISFAFVRERLRESYSDTGRPSIDPELLLRFCSSAICTASPASASLPEELRMHLAWRWFTGLGFDQEIPASFTFSKTGMDDFRSRSCSRNCLNESCASVWKWDWCSQALDRLAARSRLSCAALMGGEPLLRPQVAHKVVYYAAKR